MNMRDVSTVCIVQMLRCVSELANEAVVSHEAVTTATAGAAASLPVARRTHGGVIRTVGAALMTLIGRGAVTATQLRSIRQSLAQSCVEFAQEKQHDLEECVNWIIDGLIKDTHVHGMPADEVVADRRALFELGPTDSDDVIMTVLAQHNSIAAALFLVCFSLIHH